MGDSLSILLLLSNRNIFELPCLLTLFQIKLFDQTKTKNQKEKISIHSVSVALEHTPLKSVSFYEIIHRRNVTPTKYK